MENPQQVNKKWKTDKLAASILTCTDVVQLVAHSTS